nr:uncharacterized protein LOC117275533 [Nicotiana tomentosiformis]
MCHKLSNWKSNFLSLVGRTILEKYSPNAIPNHIMQYMSLPKKTQQQIDKIQGDFIWGTTSHNKRIHYVAWDVVTVPKNLGVWEFVKQSINIKDALAGLAWRLFTNPSTVCANTLIQKYSGRANAKTNSFIWQNMLNGWEIVTKGITWDIGNGKCIHFYYGNWIPITPRIHSITQGPFCINETNLTVSQLWYHDQWNWSQISFELVENIREKISSIFLSNNPMAMDTPHLVSKPKWHLLHILCLYLASPTPTNTYSL